MVKQCLYTNNITNRYNDYGNQTSQRVEITTLCKLRIEGLYLDTRVVVLVRNVVLLAVIKAGCKVNDR